MSEALGTALKARDRPAIEAIRSALGAIDNAEAVPVDKASAAPTAVRSLERSQASGAPRRPVVCSARP